MCKYQSCAVVYVDMYVCMWIFKECCQIVCAANFSLPSADFPTRLSTYSFFTELSVRTFPFTLFTVYAHAYFSTLLCSYKLAAYRLTYLSMPFVFYIFKHEFLS